MSSRENLTGVNPLLGRRSDSKPLRDAVRLAERAVAELASDDLVLVACSGGADSLALAVAAARCQAKGVIRVGAVVVDHALQPGSAEVAATAAQQCQDLGLSPVQIAQVAVSTEPAAGGLEAAARTARYDALAQVADQVGADCVLLAHTQDDQAETVLLGLARGSGSRSIKGMRPDSGRWRRPFLSLRRADTEAICESLGLDPYQDAHNLDSRFTRVRVRTKVIPVLQAALGESVVPALARTAQQLQEDCDALDRLAHEQLQSRISIPTAADITGARQGSVAEPTWLAAAVATGIDLGGLAVILDLESSQGLATVDRAIRTRVIRLFLLAGGCNAERLTSTHIDAIDSLVVDWRGRGPVRVPGDSEVARLGPHLLFYEAGSISAVR